jgi:hypothetical protein
MKLEPVVEKCKPYDNCSALPTLSFNFFQSAKGRIPAGQRLESA